MLGVALIMVPVVIGYQSWVYLKFRGTVRPVDFLHDNAY
jgi:cytochrome bd-type quinol oxidase subunit 2